MGSLWNKIVRAVMKKKGWMVGSSKFSWREVFRVRVVKYRINEYRVDVNIILWGRDKGEIKDEMSS